jgi:uncharacterized protein (TIGR03437 family)
VHCNLALGQSAPPVILAIDLANCVEYKAGIADPTKYTTNSNVTPPIGFKNFGVATILASGPAITHSRDFSLVSLSKPAAAGEVLSLFATGLGPTRPGVDPGSPFPASPSQAVNSPVVVTVNGKPSEVLGAVGYAGTVDGYQVNFRVPDGTAKGTAAIQVSAAWIAGPAVNIAIQ